MMATNNKISNIKIMYFGSVFICLAGLSHLIHMFNQEYQQNLQSKMFEKQGHQPNYSLLSYLDERIRTFFTDGSHFQTYEWLLHVNHNLETTYECVGPFYNQSCLFKNLYFYQDTYWIFSTKNRLEPLPEVRIGAFIMSPLTPNPRFFPSERAILDFVRFRLKPYVITNLTVFFDLPWISNIAHVLLDGLYPAYLALIRFPPRHLHPFRILLDTYSNYREHSFTPHVYRQFSGFALMNASVLRNMSFSNWFVFQEMIMGSGNLCQRCLRPNFQLPGGVEMNGSRLFRDRMYQQHGLKIPNSRKNRSAQWKHYQRPLRAFIIDNKRFSKEDKAEIKLAIDIINQRTQALMASNRSDNQTYSDWIPVLASYVSYVDVKLPNQTLQDQDKNGADSIELIKRNRMKAHLQFLYDIDIHVTGPGTGQLYQTFLLDGSVHVNLGGIINGKGSASNEKYTSFMEQYVTAGTPYIKSLYYPLNERIHGIKNQIVINLIEKAAKIVWQEFSIPVDPFENLAADGQLFVEMCKIDKHFCDTVTVRSASTSFFCLDTWAEEIAHAVGPWSTEGILDDGKKVYCPLNRTLLANLKLKHNIDPPTSTTLTSSTATSKPLTSSIPTSIPLTSSLVTTTPLTSSSATSIPFTSSIPTSTPLTSSSATTTPYTSSTPA